MISDKKVLEVAGVPLFLSSGWCFFGGFLGILELISSRSFISTGTTLFYFVIPYLLIILHEYGHALTAKAFGYDCERITVIPFGGVASIDISYDDPKSEFWIVFAGPFVNFLLALMVAPIAILVGNNLLNFILIVNVGIVVFNYLPIFPMDGGRMFRCLLGRLGIIKDPWKASVFVFYMTWILAPLFACFAIWINYYFAAAILLFMAVASWAEYKTVKTQKVKRDRFSKTLEFKIKQTYPDLESNAAQQILVFGIAINDYNEILEKTVRDYLRDSAKYGRHYNGDSWRIQSGLLKAASYESIYQNLSSDEEEMFGDFVNAPYGRRKQIGKKIALSAIERELPKIEMEIKNEQ